MIFNLFACLKKLIAKLKFGARKQENHNHAVNDDSNTEKEKSANEEISVNIITGNKEMERYEITEKLLDILKRHEGFERLPYWCPAGKLTIGYGHNLDNKNDRITEQVLEDGMSKYLAEEVLKDDIGIAVKDLCSVFPDFYNYDSFRKLALIDLMFNVGLPTFKKFKKMIEAVKNMDWETAADELEKSVWHKQVGNRAPEIEKLIRYG